MDCTFPHKSQKTNRYVCTMKITDPSLKLERDGEMEVHTLVLFAKKFEDLPISQRIGDIIRVHRVTAGTYKERKQFTANLFFNSSWALFSPIGKEEEEDAKEESKGKKQSGNFVPMTFYGKTFSFDNHEKKLITAMRQWASANFEKNQMLSNKFITPLSEVKEKFSKNEHGKFYDFDLQVKILQLFKIDDYSSEIRVTDDSGQIWFC